MKLIVGLGNPGKEYEKTRHNIGYYVLDNYLDNVVWKEEKLAYTYKTKIYDEEILFIKPTTFMNLSGNAVVHYKNYYKIDLNDIIIIHDDMDLDIGTIRLKKDSTSGGHNGIKSIIESLNSKDFLRLKIGISKPEYDVIDYVLSKFSKEEMNIIDNEIPKVNDLIDDFINNKELERLMNKYN